MVKKIFIDLGKCASCRTCEVACRIFHGIPRIRIFKYQEIMATPFNCRQCEKAPCEEVCPVKAIYRDEDGALLVNPLKCIGCMMCAIVCPFGIPELDEANKIMVKCDMCAERRAKGQLPICVALCPTEALVYGDLEEIMVKKRGRIVKYAIEVFLESGKLLAVPGVKP